MGARLSNNPTRKWLDESRPIVTGARLLRDIGKHVNRPVVVDEVLG